MQAANTLAVVDRVIGKLKTILSGYSLTDCSGELLGKQQHFTMKQVTRT